MISFDAAHAAVHYPPDRRFRIWIRPSILLAVAMLVAASESSFPRAFNPLERFIDGDSRKPCRELRPAFELRQMLVSANISFLHDVFTFGVFAKNTSYRSVDALIMGATLRRAAPIAVLWRRPALR